MGNEEEPFKPVLKQDNEFQIFKDFLTRAAKLQELGAVGSKFLGGFQQGLEFLRRPPVNRKSELTDNVIKANETERVKSYFVAGCVNTHDRVQNVSKLHTCLLGLQGHLTQAKRIINELENLLVDLTVAIKTCNRSFSPVRNEDLYANLDQETTVNQEETPSSDYSLDYAALMGIIYSMLKQDYVMQERIVSSLNFKSLAGELESYCLMWSLRPFINDEIVMQAWRYVIH
ncbi:uncharacterized protein [Euphorbia lathyris]|uniref:uncharacterized protein isoform X1 n=1 Tax=Euphorbia lathyris TaxID=212925 RepID=UPI00331398C8